MNETWNRATTEQTSRPPRDGEQPVRGASMAGPAAPALQHALPLRTRLSAMLDGEVPSRWLVSALVVAAGSLLAQRQGWLPEGTMRATFVAGVGLVTVSEVLDQVRKVSLNRGRLPWLRFVMRCAGVAVILWKFTEAVVYRAEVGQGDVVLAFLMVAGVCAAGTLDLGRGLSRGTLQGWTAVRLASGVLGLLTMLASASLTDHAPPATARWLGVAFLASLPLVLAGVVTARKVWSEDNQAERVASMS